MVPTPTPTPCSFVGYKISTTALENYRFDHSIPPNDDRSLLRHIESTIGNIPITLVRVEDELDNLAKPQCYLCCFAENKREYDDEELKENVQVPAGFQCKLARIVTLEGNELWRETVRRASLASFDVMGNSRV